MNNKKERRYFTQPPEVKTIDVPKFMKKYGYKIRLDVGTKYLLSLIAWAEQEYEDAVSFYSMAGNDYMLGVLNKRNFTHILARTDEFETVVNNMSEDVWDKIPNSVRKIIVLTKNEYDRMMTRRGK